MKKFVAIPLFVLAMMAVATAPVHAKKPNDEGSSLPRGMQKKQARGGSLPPGWQKRLQKGAVLEEEIVRQGEPVSSSIQKRLPAGEKGSIDFTLEDKIIRINETTRKVLDVFDVKM